jgi:hypothetical protein
MMDNFNEQVYRASNLLMYASKSEVITKLSEDMSPEEAYLVFIAAKILNKHQQE